MLQELGDRTQQRRLAPVQLGQQDQAIEAVVLGIAAPDLLESLLKLILNKFQVDPAIVGRLHVEVLDPDPVPVFELQLVGSLGDDTHTEVLEHRQHIGQRDRLVVLEQLEPQDALTALARLVQAHLQVFEVAQAGRGDDIEAGHVRCHIALVAQRKGTTESAQ